MLKPAEHPSNNHGYVDDYPTCVDTFSTLRIFSNILAPAIITQSLAIEPSETFLIGETYSKAALKRKANGWFYSTRERSKSRDARRHLDLLLAVLEGKDKAIRELQSKNCQIDVLTYWESAGQGGPWLMPSQMLRLGNLGIAAWYDIYFEEADNEVPVNETPGS